MNLKYIDPSYTIRSLPANPRDSAFCLLLGHNAVHAGMTGRTNMLVGYWKGEFTHVPIRLAVSSRKKIDPNGGSGATCSPARGSPGKCGSPKGSGRGGSWRGCKGARPIGEGGSRGTESSKQDQTAGDTRRGPRSTRRGVNFSVFSRNAVAWSCASTKSQERGAVPGDPVWTLKRTEPSSSGTCTWRV